MESKLARRALCASIAATALFVSPACKLKKQLDDMHRSTVAMDTRLNAMDAKTGELAATASDGHELQRTGGASTTREDNYQILQTSAHFGEKKKSAAKYIKAFELQIAARLAGEAVPESVLKEDALREFLTTNAHLRLAAADFAKTKAVDGQDQGELAIPDLERAVDFTAADGRLHNDMLVLTALSATLYELSTAKKADLANGKSTNDRTAVGHLIEAALVRIHQERKQALPPAQEPYIDLVARDVEFQELSVLLLSYRYNFIHHMLLESERQARAAATAEVQKAVAAKKDELTQLAAQGQVKPADIPALLQAFAAAAQVQVKAAVEAAAETKLRTATNLQRVQYAQKMADELARLRQVFADAGLTPRLNRSNASLVLVLALQTEQAASLPPVPPATNVAPAATSSDPAEVYGQTVVDAYQALKAQLGGLALKAAQAEMDKEYQALKGTTPKP